MTVWGEPVNVLETLTDTDIMEDYTDRFSWVPSTFAGQGAACPWDEVSGRGCNLRHVIPLTMCVRTELGDQAGFQWHCFRLVFMNHDPQYLVTQQTLPTINSLHCKHGGLARCCNCSDKSKQMY